MVGGIVVRESSVEGLDIGEFVESDKVTEALVDNGEVAFESDQILGVAEIEVTVKVSP